MTQQGYVWGLAPKTPFDQSGNAESIVDFLEYVAKLKKRFGGARYGSFYMADINDKKYPPVTVYGENVSYAYYLEQYAKYGFVPLINYSKIKQQNLFTDDNDLNKFIGDAFNTVLSILNRLPPWLQRRLGQRRRPFPLIFYHDKLQSSSGSCHFIGWGQVTAVIHMKLNMYQYGELVSTFLHELAHLRLEREGYTMDGRGYKLKAIFNVFKAKNNLSINPSESKRIIHELVAYTAETGNVKLFLKWFMSEFRIRRGAISEESARELNNKVKQFLKTYFFRSQRSIEDGKNDYNWIYYKNLELREYVGKINDDPIQSSV